MLRQYKEIYPNMSYEKIYAGYIREIEENDNISKEEKLYQYLWFKYSADTGEASKIPAESQMVKRRNGAYPVIAAGSMLMLGAAVLTKVRQRDRG